MITNEEKLIGQSLADEWRELNRVWAKEIKEGRKPNFQKEIQESVDAMAKEKKMASARIRLIFFRVFGMWPEPWVSELTGEKISDRFSFRRDANPNYHPVQETVSQKTTEPGAIEYLMGGIRHFLLGSEPCRSSRNYFEPYYQNRYQPTYPSIQKQAWTKLEKMVNDAKKN